MVSTWVWNGGGKTRKATCFRRSVRFLVPSARYHNGGVIQLLPWRTYQCSMTTFWPCWSPSASSAGSGDGCSSTSNFTGASALRFLPRPPAQFNSSFQHRRWNELGGWFCLSSDIEMLMNSVTKSCLWWCIHGWIQNQRGTTDFKRVRVEKFDKCQLVTATRPHAIPSSTHLNSTPSLFPVDLPKLWRGFLISSSTSFFFFFCSDLVYCHRLSKWRNYMCWEQKSWFSGRAFYHQRLWKPDVIS